MSLSCLATPATMCAQKHRQTPLRDRGGRSDMTYCTKRLVCSLRIENPRLIGRGGAAFECLRESRPDDSIPCSREVMDARCSRGVDFPSRRFFTRPLGFVTGSHGQTAHGPIHRFTPHLVFHCGDGVCQGSLFVPRKTFAVRLRVRSPPGRCGSLGEHQRLAESSYASNSSFLASRSRVSSPFGL